MFVRVLPDQAAGRLLDYRVPECFADKVAVGSRVKVPVRTRMLTATVVELLDFSGIKYIISYGKWMGAGALMAFSSGARCIIFISWLIITSTLVDHIIGKHF